MKSFVLIVSIILIAVSFATAQVPTVPNTPSIPTPSSTTSSVPKELPLTREKQQAYALNLVNWISGGVGGNSITGTSYFSGPVNQADGNPNNIAKVFKTYTLDYSVDPSEKLTHFAQWEMRMADGNTIALFHGYKDFNLVKDAKGNWTVPSEALKITNLTFQMVPIPFPGIQSGYIIVRDSAGNQINYINLNENGLIRDGYLYLGNVQPNSSGEMYITTSDGTRYVYGLSDGKLRSSNKVTATGMDVSDPTVRVLPDNTVSITCKSTDNVVRCLYTLDNNCVVLFDAGTTLPYNVIVVDKATFDANPNGGTSYDPKKGSVNFKVKAGQTMLIIFEHGGSVIVGTGGKG